MADKKTVTPEEKKLAAEKHVDGLVQKALVALEEMRKLDQDQVDYIVAKASVAALDAHGELALHAFEETGRGVFEDKATKNLFACEHVVNNMRHTKTVGVIEEDDVTGLTLIAEPVGVVCGITPTTNPTSTAIFKALISLKTRNPIVFAFHPSAQESSAHAAQIVRDAAIKAGAPENCVQWITEPSMEATSALMNHEGIATILATGGNAMVKAAYSCGKPALGVGAGNVPAYVEKSANIRQAAHDIVMSKSFDNGMVCASEQAVIIDKEIYDEFVAEFKSYHTYFVNKKEKALLEEFCFGVKANSKNCAGAKLNADIVGKPATWIAEQAGFTVPEGTNILAAECKEVGENEPLTREKLSPVIAVLKAESREDGIAKARQMVEFNGLGHSAAIHTADEELTKEFGKAVKAIRVICNSPSTFGGIGDVYNAFLPSLTLGCGSYGRNSVGDNVSAINLLNIKKVGRRRNNMQWMKLPSKTYFERDKANNRKYPIADYSLTPTVAIVDPALVLTVPGFVAADTGMDVLTHATEAYVSQMASDYTDGLALQAIKLVFENLESSVKNADFHSREKMHNASTIAGMAFANAFLGISHSMAHKIGAQFHTVHGRTNAILLPYVIRYNGTRPAKAATWPKYNYYRADEKYQDIARMLGLPASTPEEGVESYAKAVYELGERVGIQMNFKAQGIDEKEWKEHSRELAFLAYEDQCSPANPRLPMVDHMQEIIEDAYYGYKERPGRRK